MKIVEPLGVQDTFCTVLARVDVIPGGFARFVLCTERADDDGSVELRVAAKIIMPLSAVPDAMLKTTQATAVGMIGFVEARAN